MTQLLIVVNVHRGGNGNDSLREGWLDFWLTICILLTIVIPMRPGLALRSSLTPSYCSYLNLVAKDKPHMVFSFLTAWAGILTPGLTLGVSQ